MSRRAEYVIEVSNLICRFGEEKVLLDLAEEIVIPAFTDEALERTYDNIRYFFHDVRKVVLDPNTCPPTIGIAGRLIKDTKLVREQVFETGKGLVRRSGELPSAPSAIFLLILNCHRLVYVGETRHAPSKDAFKSTLHSFLRFKHREFIERVLRERQATSPRTTKKSVVENFPPPTLEIVALTSEPDISSFIRRYEKLNVLEIKLIDRNDENDNEKFFEELQKRKDKLNSKNSTVRHISKDGLSKDQAITEVKEATQQGNQKITLKGVDSLGDKLQGNNENFQIKVSIPDLKESVPGAASQLFEAFSNLAKSGAIKLPEIGKKSKTIVEDLLRRFNGS